MSAPAPRDRLIVALDVPSLALAEALADRLGDAVRWFKIGPHLFVAEGPAAVSAIARRGRVFLDAKFHDIPSTVSAAVEAAARAGASLCTVHASGGSRMMRAALEGAGRGSTGDSSPTRGTAADAGGASRALRVVGVTVLTSADEAVLAETGVAGSPLEATVRLARLAKAAGLAGAVASPLEVRAVRADCGPEFLLVCPGIRSAGSAGDDQRRVHTPKETIAAGADMLVVGRPITQAPDPREAAEAILREMASSDEAL